MTRIAIAALLVGATSGLISAQAPSGVGNWYTATTTIVKPGMMEEYRQLIIKELNPAAKKGGATQVQTWRFATGNTNRVLRIAVHNSLADRDSPAPARKGMGDAAFAAYGKKVAALVDGTSTYIGQQRLDMGWTRPDSPAPKLAERYTVRIAPGRNAEYLKYVQAFLEAAKKSGHQRTAGQIVFGANAGPGVFVSNTYYENWADLAKGRPPDRVMSATELAAFNKLNSPGLITVISRDVTTFDAEMSFSSPATSSR
jgi:hypothetical protein